MELDLNTGEGVEQALNIIETTKYDIKNSLPWIEKYRSETVDGIILPDSIKNVVNTALEKVSFSHYILYSGSPGTGKTTLARAIPNTLGTEHLFLSAKRATDIIDEIEQYAIHKNLGGLPRFVVIDEADKPNNPEDFYRKLQGLIEKTSTTLRFILTCNEIWRIPEAIKSRCYPIDFTCPNNDKKIKNEIYKRLNYIALSETEKEHGNVDKNTIVNIINKHYPDIRYMIQTMHYMYLQNNGSIIGDPVVLEIEYLEKIFNFILENDVIGARYFIATNNINMDGFYVEFARYVIEKLDQSIRAQFSVIVSEYAYKSCFRVDPELMINGFICNVMLLINSIKKK